MAAMIIQNINILNNRKLEVSQHGGIYTKGRVGYIIQVRL